MTQTIASDVASGQATIVQYWMRARRLDVITIQQAIKQRTVQRRRLTVSGPFETVFFQPFVPEYKAIFFPAEDFDLVTLAIAEHEQSGINGDSGISCSTSAASPLMDLRISTGLA